MTDGHGSSGSGLLGWLAAAATTTAALIAAGLFLAYIEGERPFNLNPVDIVRFSGSVYFGVLLFTAVPTALFLWASQRFDFYGVSTCIACGAMIGGLYGLLVSLSSGMAAIGAISGYIGWWVKDKTSSPTL
jgi:hypothetical protein